MSVRVDCLSKRFAQGGPPAAEEVSFAAPAGAITTLLGPSGSGKTTVLRLIAGLEVPDGGRVWLDETDVTRTPVRRRGVGFVFQGYALFEHLSVRGNIAFGLSLKKLPRAQIDQRVNELLALVQLEGLGGRFPSQLSGGQKQRVAFARALATQPKVLLLDEPFGALDARVRVELREWLVALNERTHITTLLVTHDQEEALEVSQQLVVMHEGRVRQVGPPHEVYDHPNSEFIASFIGGTNVLRGRVVNGRAAAGPLLLEAPAGAREGEKVSAFVRPHQVRILRPTDHAGPVSLATVTELVRIGGYVRVSLRLATNESLTVQMLKSELDALGVVQGDRVMVDVGQAKVLVGDYAI
ncbi:MAG: sulfate/molybdate ABC transporter ATP-binding protein [Myxococcota bacterium]